jgi:hypothetical protein
MKRITIDAYTAKEILEGKHSGQVQAKVRDWLQEIACEHGWHVDIYDCVKPELEKLGFLEPDINFSGFCCQGDGASFTATLDLEKLLDSTEQTDRAKRFLRFMIEREWVEIQLERTDSHYSHERTVSMNFTFYDKGKWHRQREHPYREVWLSRHKKLRKLVEDFVKEIDELRVRECRRIYKELEEDYEARICDEAIIDLAEANEWLFDSCGRIVVD